MTFLFTVLGKLTPEWIGHLTWPELVLFGIVSALAASFALALIMLTGAVAIRLIRREPFRAAIGDLSSPSAGEWAALEENTSALRGAVETQLQRLEDQQNDIERIDGRIAQINSPPSVDLSPISERLGQIDRKLSERTDTLWSEIWPAVRVARAMVAREKLRMVEEEMARIEHAIERKGPHPVFGDMERPERTSEDAWHMLERIGATDRFKSYGVRLKEMQDAIKGDAKYLTLMPGEEAYWPTGEAKRTGHYKLAFYQAWVLDLRQIRDELARQSEILQWQAGGVSEPTPPPPYSKEES